jgi:hypothetical protein
MASGPRPKARLISVDEFFGLPDEGRHRSHVRGARDRFRRRSVDWGRVLKRMGVRFADLGWVRGRAGVGVKVWLRVRYSGLRELRCRAGTLAGDCVRSQTCISGLADPPPNVIERMALLETTLVSWRGDSRPARYQSALGAGMEKFNASRDLLLLKRGHETYKSIGLNPHRIAAVEQARAMNVRPGTEWIQ